MRTSTSSAETTTAWGYGSRLSPDDDGERSPTGKSIYANQKQIGFVQPSREKYFASEFRKNVVFFAPSRLDEEGRMRIVTRREAGSDGRGWYHQTSDTIADGKGVWSWRPWAGAKVAGNEPANDGD